MNEPTAAELLWKAAQILTAIPVEGMATAPEMTLRSAAMVTSFAEELEEFADRMIHAATYFAEPRR
jgi:hypothetical protein